MNEHSKRLIENILHSIDMYEQKIIDEIGLMQDIEGTCGAIEERYIQVKLERIVAVIEESRYLYEVEEGRSFLLREIQNFKESILQ
jgi:hypothetical protein